jgi:hypothetical protein
LVRTVDGVPDSPVVQEPAHSVADALEDWRQAEREEDVEPEGSATRGMAHRRTQIAQKRYEERFEREMKAQRFDQSRRDPSTDVVPAIAGASSGE